MKTPLLELGFRPFFLIASFFAALAIASWTLIFTGHLQLNATIDSTTWHAHEMLYGFSLAILIGFLLTASQNWSGIRGVHGKKLLLLIIIWVAGRLSFFYSPFQIIDLILIPYLIWCLRPYVWLKDNPRNKKILFLLGFLWGADLLIHFGQAQLGRAIAVDIVVAFIILIGGRVIPFFRVKALGPPKLDNHNAIETSSAVIYTLFTLSLFLETQIPRSIFAGLLFITHSFRWYRWAPLSSIKPPILGILYIGYFWLLLGFLSIAVHIPLNLSNSISTHFFTVGMIGVITLGMINRVSLGHTGRQIKVSSLMLLAYTSINIATISRTLLPVLLPSQYLLLIKLSGTLWALAFLLYFIEFFNILRRPRIP